MNLNEFHFIREILVRDYRNNEIPTMQASSANASCLHAKFKQVSFYEQDAVRAFYRELGGGRSEGSRLGSTIILPNRSLWASLWRISPAEVLVIPSPDSNELSADTQHAHKERAREANRLMRD